MTETQDQRKPPQAPDDKGQKRKPLADFEAKRAQNLRDNLARRKQQTRGREKEETK